MIFFLINWEGRKIMNTYLGNVYGEQNDSDKVRSSCSLNMCPVDAGNCSANFCLVNEVTCSGHGCIIKK